MVEIRVLSQLSHPNIVAFKGACMAPPHICILEEVRGSLTTDTLGPNDLGRVSGEGGGGKEGSGQLRRRPACALHTQLLHCTGVMLCITESEG
jgi:hypothetical protein